MSKVNLVPNTARSALCVPAGDERKLAKALASGADEVVVDLEDAVSVGEKDAARAHLAGYEWPVGGPAVSVRVNAIGTPWFALDMEVVSRIDAVTSIVLPKVESRAELALAERVLDDLECAAGRTTPLAVQALVETAAGMVRLADIVSDPRRLTVLIVGYADLAASLGRARDIGPQAWGGVRDAIVMHARAANVVPVDGPYLSIADDVVFRAEVADAAALGFDGKWVIHPRQVEVVNQVFTPSGSQIDHAHAVLAALNEAAVSGLGAAALDGALIDEAMARDARRVLSKAGM